MYGYWQKTTLSYKTFMSLWSFSFSFFFGTAESPPRVRRTLHSVGTQWQQKRMCKWSFCGEHDLHLNYIAWQGVLLRSRKGLGELEQETYSLQSFVFRYISSKYSNTDSHGRENQRHHLQWIICAMHSQDVYLMAGCEQCDLHVFA